MADEAFGLLALGDVALAVELEALREVVPSPDRLDALPARAPGLVGALRLRELVVPVVDLRAALDPAASTEGAVVAVVSDGERLVGVLADRTEDVVRVAAEDVQPVVGSGLLLCRTFRHPVGGTTVSVLDVAALLALPGLPSVQGTTVRRRAAAQEAAARTADRRTLTVVRRGDLLLGLDVDDVHTTIAGAEVRAAALTGGLAHGVCAFRGLDVAAVDPVALLGAPLPAQPAASAVVLTLDEGFVLLQLDELVANVDVAPEDVLAVPAFSLARPDLVAGVVELGDGRRCVVLDGPALRRDADLTGLAGLNVRTADEALRAEAGAVDGDAVATGPMHLAYVAGRHLATPLKQVAEILPVPELLTGATADAAVLGVALHRQAAVPVLCLATLLGDPPTAAPGCVLVVEADGHRIGFAIASLETIAPATWTPTTGAAAAGARDEAVSRRLVRVADVPGMLAVLDLHELAQDVLRRGRPSPVALAA